MIKYPNYRFRTCISVDGYEKKTDATACLSKAGAAAVGKEKMAFRLHTVTIDEFLQYATTGHAFCNLFQFDCDQKYWVTTSTGKHFQTYPVYKTGRRSGAMKLNFKSDEFFYGAQVVYVDVDYTRYVNVMDYLLTLTFPPTGVYMSYSDGIAKGKESVVSRRFRLVYVLDQVYGRDDLKRISSAITDQIIFDTAEPMADDCGERPCQYMNGVYGNNETYTSNFIYTVSDFPQEVDPPLTPPSVQGQSEPEIVFNEDLLREMATYSYQDFMHYHSWQYRYVYRTERPDDWIDGMFQLTDENYLQLWYYREKQVDGQNRRRKLFKNACLRRLMYPDIDAETLLFNLYVDRWRFFDNSDGAITLDTLKRKVKQAMGKTPEQLAAYCDREIRWCKEHRPRFITKRGYVTNRGMISHITKRILWAEIDRAYDKSISLKENLDTSLVDLDVSASTLYRYCKERFIDPDPDRPEMTAREKREAKRLEKARNIERFKDLYDPDLSLRKNQEIMEDAGLKMSMGRLVDWIDKYITPEEPSQPKIEPFTSGFTWTAPDYSSWGNPQEDDPFAKLFQAAKPSEPEPQPGEQQVAFQPFSWEPPHFEFPHIW